MHRLQIASVRLSVSATESLMKIQKGIVNTRRLERLTICTNVASKVQHRNYKLLLVLIFHGHRAVFFGECNAI